MQTRVRYAVEIAKSSAARMLVAMNPILILISTALLAG